MCIIVLINNIISAQKHGIKIICCDYSLVSVLRSHQESSHGSPHCQTVLLSATLTKQVEKLAGLTLQSPVRLDASDCSEEELVIPQSLNQMYVVTPAKLRLVTLAGFIVWKCQVLKSLSNYQF